MGIFLPSADTVAQYDGNEDAWVFEGEAFGIASRGMATLSHRIMIKFLS